MAAVADRVLINHTPNGFPDTSPPAPLLPFQPALCGHHLENSNVVVVVVVGGKWMRSVLFKKEKKVGAVG